jgi:hypothetical protein
MPTLTYIPLATVTLTGPDSEIVFSSIPATYRHLVIVKCAATSANSNNIMRFNGDANNNYTGIFMTGNGSSATTGSPSGSFAQTDSSAFTTTTVGQTNSIVQIFDYAATNKHKTVLVRANRAAGAVDTLFFRYASLSAITSIQLRPNNTNFTWSSGSTFSLYGIA